MRAGSRVIEAVVAHARDARPAECCGVLLGRGDEIVEAVRCRNLDDNPNRFLIDPNDHFAARKRARAQGLDVIGFYHSHPHSPPAPSPTDVAEAAYPDSLSLIVSLRSEVPETQLFRLESGRFVETPLVILDR